MWNPFVDRVDADSETLNGWSNRHRELLDNNVKWQRQAEELAGRHEQRISELEKNLEEKEVYISNIKCMLADLSGRVNEMEGKLCRYHEEDTEVAEVKDDDDPTSELSYETVYHTPVAIAGLLEDVPNRLVPIRDLEITRGGFKEEVRDGDEDSVRIRSHDSNTTRNSGEFPRYVYLLVTRFPETLEFPMFSISGKLRNSDVSIFRKLRTPTFFVISHSFMYFTFHL